jgi:hypothetical protein
MTRRSFMGIRIIELGRVGEETKGNPSFQSPHLEMSPKTERRNIFIGDLAV